MKTILIVIAIILAVILGSFLIKVLFFPIHTAQQELNTAYDAVSKTINADNAIYNYEWFKQTFEDIQAVERQLDNAIKSKVDFMQSLSNNRTDMTFEDKQEESRLRSVVDGLYNHKQDLIANYNARAKMANRNIFENSILPNYLDALTFITK